MDSEYTVTHAPPGAVQQVTARKAGADSGGFLYAEGDLLTHRAFLAEPQPLLRDLPRLFVVRRRQEGCQEDPRRAYVCRMAGSAAYLLAPELATFLEHELAPWPAGSGPAT